MKTKTAGSLAIKKATFIERKNVGGETKAYTYGGYALRGWVKGQRVRRQFRTYGEALTAKSRLEVEAADADGEIHAVNTRLTAAQVRLAEIAFGRLGEHSLPIVVDWYLANYRPPLDSVPIEVATAEFMRDRETEVSMPVVVDYRKLVKLLIATFPGRTLDTIVTGDLEKIMGRWGESKRSRNNLRTYLHAFFEFGAHHSRRWVSSNPVKAIRKFEIARGMPDVMPVERVAEMFRFLDTYSGPKRSGHKPGYLVPYFALATFAGIRPSVRDGELRKIHELGEKNRIIDVEVGVIRVTPDIAKTKDLRQITIQPNLAAWLARYPIAEHPLIVRNMTDHTAIVRKRFALTNDVLRHTFISMHVAKFKSLGDAALQAGNSEAMIKKHYLNMVTDAQAAAFWSIAPSAEMKGKSAA